MQDVWDIARSKAVPVTEELFDSTPTMSASSALLSMGFCRLLANHLREALGGLVSPGLRGEAEGSGVPLNRLKRYDVNSKEIVNSQVDVVCRDEFGSVRLLISVKVSNTPDKKAAIRKYCGNLHNRLKELRCDGFDYRDACPDVPVVGMMFLPQEAALDGDSAAARRAGSSSEAYGGYSSFRWAVDLAAPAVKPTAFDRVYVALYRKSAQSNRGEDDRDIVFFDVNSELSAFPCLGLPRFDQGAALDEVIAEITALVPRG